MSQKTSFESESSSKIIEGINAYQEAKRLFFGEHRTDISDEKALYLFDKAIECGLTEAYYDRGICLQSLHYYLDAINDYDKAIVMKDQDPNLYYCRGLCKKIVGDYKGAMSDLGMAVRLSQKENKLNREYDDEMRKKGYNSATDFFKFHLLELLDRIESEIDNENLRELYQDMAKEKSMKRRFD